MAEVQMDGERSEALTWLAKYLRPPPADQVYRGEAYDLTPYLSRHPGGRWLLNLAVGRDCTALFESYHLRPEVAVNMLQRLPKLPDFPVDAVPRSPRPNDSDFYNTVRWSIPHLS